jgi:hypothetical protein
MSGQGYPDGFGARRLAVNSICDLKPSSSSAVITDGASSRPQPSANTQSSSGKKVNVVTRYDCLGGHLFRRQVVGLGAV